ncbi:MULTISPECIES: glutathione S-transferase [unclassified Sphingomonas]|uniref:glutathione S-transferase n=1 Tax=unclassified Sphingomonas TaxID=196159 RepID=UPI0007013A6B|nr:MULTISPECIES: glutathione S-transferase [unclassified Sphingomonas]KQX17675.1 glutathione S-transferase [Sphingomonas sp. Root1294]KQY70601.1 glutathione S-transferase [Sphingomonas sp. Root50]KRB91908.1 glutathione S-transferase [Sphingomonas sp. Root720]
MTPRPILYSFRRCPYAMRARLALLVGDTGCEIREVKLSAKPAELVAASPKATVPVLQLPDGTVIDQSLAIMRWALGRSDPEGWLDRADEALVAANDGPFKHHLDRYKYPERYRSDREEHRAAGLAMLAVLEERLAAAPYLGGEARGLTDAAVFPFVRQFAGTDPGWFDAAPLPHLRDWLSRQAGSALFQGAMVRLAPWKAGDPPISFPAA